MGLQLARADPSMAAAWHGAASNCIWLGRWEDAIRYAQTGLAHHHDRFELYDVLTHAYGSLGQGDEVRRYGLQALNIRVRRFSGEPVIPLTDLPPMPPPPSAQTRERNVIAFSLFGRDSKYCEPAVLNVQEQPNIYPHWVCRFYVDDSVPKSVIARLRAGGAQIVTVDGPAAQWPGPMWRLLALDDPQVHRILFRDTDSIISRCEAAAVGQWLTSGKRFHMMRDWFGHTELILAGLWGVVGGSLPPLGALIDRFMSAPLESRHFADQFFLRHYVWPYVRTSLMQHDSMFGFMGGVPFPDAERSPGFHVGCMESVLISSPKNNLPDGAEVTWGLFRIEKRDNGQTREEMVCSYTNATKDGIVRAYIPRRYAHWIEQGTAYVRLVKSDAT